MQLALKLTVHVLVRGFFSPTPSVSFILMVTSAEAAEARTRPSNRVPGMIA
jgi:hypothetical protein